MSYLLSPQTGQTPVPSQVQHLAIPLAERAAFLNWYAPYPSTRKPAHMKCSANAASNARINPTVSGAKYRFLKSLALSLFFASFSWRCNSTRNPSAARTYETYFSGSSSSRRYSPTPTSRSEALACPPSLGPVLPCPRNGRQIIIEPASPSGRGPACTPSPPRRRGRPTTGWRR